MKDNLRTLFSFIDDDRVRDKLVGSEDRIRRSFNELFFGLWADSGGCVERSCAGQGLYRGSQGRGHQFLFLLRTPLCPLPMAQCLLCISREKL